MSLLLPFVITGLTLHLLSNRFERTHLPALKLLLAILPLGPTLLLWEDNGYNEILIAYLTSYVTLIMSILAYRLSPFHPLYKYPGPLVARCTKFWAVYQNYTGKLHVTTLNLHRKYGPVVRTGPNELSITDVDAVQPVFGTHGMIKGPLFEGRWTSGGPTTLILIRDDKKHMERRKYWSKALNVSSVKEYQPALKNRADELVNILKSKADGATPIDLAEWVSFFAYDFMGDMAFGEGFELMRDGDINNLWNLMENGIVAQSYSQHIPWAADIILNFPPVGKGLADLRAFAMELAKNRIERRPNGNGIDLSSHFLGEVQSSTLDPLPVKEYYADSFLIIVAGSDTTSTALSNIFFNLVSHPDIFKRLRNEIEEYFPNEDDFLPTDDISKLADLPLLNAVMYVFSSEDTLARYIDYVRNESLRLCPPVPTGLQRGPCSDEGGKLIGTKYIPEGTHITIPPYVIHRDPRYFGPNPDLFIPDRWLSDNPSFQLNHEAFIPFSTGPMHCSGKLLAQMELRAVVASIVREFDISFQQGWDPKKWEDSLRDALLFKKGKLPVVLIPRNAGKA